MKTALSIAGSDSSGGAGIQADIKTMTMHGVFAMTAVTALTAQNTTGVRAVLESTPEFLGQQLDAVFEDIHPDAVKIGMVSSRKSPHTESYSLVCFKVSPWFNKQTNKTKAILYCFRGIFIDILHPYSLLLHQFKT